MIELWHYRVEVRAVDRIIASETGDALQPYQAWMKIGEFLSRHSEMIVVSGMASEMDFNEHRQTAPLLTIIAQVAHVP
jgi:hypothetical protein